MGGHDCIHLQWLHLRIGSCISSLHTWRERCLRSGQLLGFPRWEFDVTHDDLRYQTDATVFFMTIERPFTFLGKGLMILQTIVGEERRARRGG